MTPKDGAEEQGVRPKTAGVAGMVTPEVMKVVPGNDYLFKTKSRLYNDVCLTN